MLVLLLLDIVWVLLCWFCWCFVGLDTVYLNGVSATKVLCVEDDQNAIVKVPIRSLVTCDLDFLAPRRVTYALLQDEGG